MDKLKNFYDRRFLSNYREKLSGYEIARWGALEHFIRKVLKPDNVTSVLDYGCGSGLHVALWKNVFPSAKLYFCDISVVALEKLITKYPEFKLDYAEIQTNKAPFNNDFFDLIVSIEVMEHVLDMDEYLNDIHWLLKPGGFFVWTPPCANSFSIEHLYSASRHQIEKTAESYRRWKWEDSSHLRRLKSNQIKEKLQDVGFNNVTFRFRAHFFSFVCTYLFRGPLRKLGEKLMLLDYSLFRRLPNGASMIGYAQKI